MIDKVIFPLSLGDREISGTFFTDEKISMDVQIAVIKHMFPYILSSIDARLVSKEMSVKVYSYTKDRDIISVALATSLHLMKMSLSGDIFNVSITNAKSGNIISSYDLDDLTEHFSIKRISDVHKSLYDDGLEKNMTRMFDLFIDVLVSKFIIKIPE